jgi:hypothetical protein
VRLTKSLRGLAVAGATLTTLCLAAVPALAAGQPASARATSAAPGDQLWASKLADGTAITETVSPDGTTVYVTGYDRAQDFKTVAYSAATGNQLWATTSQLATYNFAHSIVVSPDGATVYVSGDTFRAGIWGFVTVAYGAATGKQLWVTRYMPKGLSYVGGIVVGPQGKTLYVTGYHQDSENTQPAIVTMAYAAATGQQRWQRSYTRQKYSVANSAALSPDGKTLYVAGYGGVAGGASSALTIAYQSDGTVKWVAQYKNPFVGATTKGQASAAQLVVGPGGTTIYVVGEASNKSGHFDITTFAYSAATGKRLWLARYQARAGGVEPSYLAVAPDGKSVIVTGPHNGSATGYVLASYNASTGATQWTQKISASRPAVPTGLVIDPQSDTVYVADTVEGTIEDTSAYAVTDGSLRWTSSSSGTATAAIRLSDDGTRLFVTGSTKTGLATIAYQP